MYQTVLITWASSGIWLELAHIFAKKWFHLVLVARNTGVLEDIKEKYTEIEVIVIQKDLSVLTAPQEVFEEVSKAGVHIDILINNAGFWEFGYFHEIDKERQLQMIDLNVRALTELTYLFGGEMVKKQRGKILNLASIAAFLPGPLMSVYFATKHYVLALSESLAEEWKDHNIQVTALCPWPTQSWFQKGAHMEESKLVKWKKLPTAKEVAVFGYESLMQWKRVAVHWLDNQLLIQAMKFLPRFLQAKMVKNTQDK